MAGLDPDLSSYNGYAATNKLLATPTNTPENALQWQGYAQGQQNLQRGQLQLSQQHLSALNDLVSSVMADPSPANAYARVQDGIHQGVISPEDGASELAAFSQMAAGQQDPTQPNDAIRRYAFQHGQPLVDAMQRMQMGGMGTPSYVSNGQQQVPVVAQGGLHPGINPAGGAPIQMQQSPGELAGPVTVKGPDGVEHTMTQGQFQGAAGNPYAKIAGGGYKVVNGQMVPSGVGGIPGIAGPAPGTVNAADSTAQAGAQMGTALTAAADKATDRRATLSNMQADLGKITTGPNAEAINTAKAGANAIADLTMGQGTGPRFDQQSIAASEQFRKSAQILANQQQAALGGTDAALAAGAHSNPNLDLSTLGNRQILSMLQGNEDAIQVKNAEWQKWLQAGNSPASYPQFAAQLNKTFSPRAFQFAHMTPAERADMVKTMNPQDRAALAGALSTARQSGWINPTNGQ